MSNSDDNSLMSTVMQNHPKIESVLDLVTLILRVLTLIALLYAGIVQLTPV